MTKMSQGNKKITTRKIPGMNSKVLVSTGSLCLFKKYLQPITKIWCVPVLVFETVQNFYHVIKTLVNSGT